MSLIFCCDERRRDAVRKQTKLNGIDFLEVVDHDWSAQGYGQGDRQLVLLVSFVNPLGTALQSVLNQLPAPVQITGGVRVKGIRVVSAKAPPAPPNPPPGTPPTNVLEVEVDQPGDFSTYTLALVDANGNALRDSGGHLVLDPKLSTIDFSFKVECGGDFDCKPDDACAPTPVDEPEIDYLAKDYTSFRKLMLDRLALVLPAWTERNPADLGVTLVEMLAYVGDALSYEQDAVATEAYLSTARRRVSARRHARMLDYFMHDGCNARVWLQVLLAGSEVVPLQPGDLQAFTQVAGVDQVVTLQADPNQDAPASKAAMAKLVTQGVCFEPMAALDLYPELADLQFYTWGDGRCCLPRGATSATLVAPKKPDGTLLVSSDGTPLLNSVLVFEEVLGPDTGQPGDADLSHRCAVRLTSVSPPSDPLGGRFQDPPNDGSVPVVEIGWDLADALPFPVCISSVTDEEHGSVPIVDVSIAHGNIVLADHGRTLSGEMLDPVPSPDPRLAPVSGTSAHCNQQAPTLVPARFSPQLASGPVTQAARVSKTQLVDGVPVRLGFDASAPASAAFVWDMSQVVPEVKLADGDRTWSPQRDLLASDELALDFVVEVDDRGLASLRFGDDEHGARPRPGSVLTAAYRVGNGVAGNVGAAALWHAVVTLPTAGTTHIVGVRNPMPAQGGVDPETIAHVRASAPYAFRIQQRAVTPDDYATVAALHPDVKRAVATIRWTGSWRTVYLTVERLGGRSVDSAFADDLRSFMERYRMAGRDVEIDGPAFVALEVDMTVCVLPDFFESDVEAALLRVFSGAARPDGSVGFFYPDNFTFAQPVYLSQLYAAAQQVTGVRSVQITTFQRLGVDASSALASGVLAIGRLEIAQLANDPNFPERGVLRLTMEGGR